MPTPELDTFSKRLVDAWNEYEIAHARELPTRKLTQAEFARRVGAIVGEEPNQSSVSDWRANTDPSLYWLPAIARVLEVEPAWLAWDIGPRQARVQVEREPNGERPVSLSGRKRRTGAK